MAGRNAFTASQERNRRPIWMGRPSSTTTIVKAVVLSVIVVVMLYPFLYVIASSFASTQALSRGALRLIPTSFSLDAYAAVLSGSVVTRALMVSIGITTVGTAISVVLTVLFTMLFGAGIIPNYLLVKNLGLLDSYASLVLPGAISAFNLVVVRSFFMNIPRDLIDAATIDGASEWKVLSRIVVPLSKSAIAVIALFYGVAYWNDFFNALIYLNDTGKWPVQLVLNQYVLQGSPLTQLQNPSSTPPPAESVQMAVVVLATLPILLVYPFIQRHFTKGVLTGAIKG
jgi:putative aldouronate transport system permease protein